MVSTYEDAALPRARACNDADLAHVYPGRLLPEEPPRLIVAHGSGRGRHGRSGLRSRIPAGGARPPPILSSRGEDLLRAASCEDVVVDLVDFLELRYQYENTPWLSGLSFPKGHMLSSLLMGAHFCDAANDSRPGPRYQRTTDCS